MRLWVCGFGGKGERGVVEDWFRDLGLEEGGRLSEESALRDIEM